MNIILLGAPGAGKGTQAVRIADEYLIPHISTGDIFRENIRNNTELGALAKSYIDKGQLVPDEVTVEIVKDRLAKDDCRRGYLLDGFPRTLVQAEALNRFADIDIVVNIDIDLGLLLKRLIGRRVCPGCGASYHVDTLKGSNVCAKCGAGLIHREDDTESVVQSRLNVYTKQTAPLIEYYESNGILRDVDGGKSIDAVFEDIKKLLDAKKA